MAIDLDLAAALLNMQRAREMTEAAGLAKTAQVIQRSFGIDRFGGRIAQLAGREVSPQIDPLAARGAVERTWQRHRQHQRGRPAAEAPNVEVPGNESPRQASQVDSNGVQQQHEHDRARFQAVRLEQELRQKQHKVQQVRQRGYSNQGVA